MLLFIVCLTLCKHCANMMGGRWCGLSAVFGFRLPEDLRQYLQKMARQQRTTVSHYLIMLVLQDMKNKTEGKSIEKD